MDEHRGQTRIRISGPDGLLAVVPSSLGFHPTDSLVLMCFTGGRSALGPVARVDLPRGRNADLVNYLVGVALTHADRVVVVCYPRRRRRPAVMTELIEELLAAGIGVMNGLIVHAGRYWEAPRERTLRLADSYPVPGLHNPTVAALAAENALTGRAVLADREQLRNSIAGPRGDRRRIAEAAIIAVAQGRGPDLPEPTARTGTRAAVDGFSRPLPVSPLPDRLERAVAGALAQVADRGTVSAELAAELAVCCLDRTTRDAILLRGLFEFDRVWLPMLISCAAWTPDAWAAGVCAVLSVIAYRHGEGALAQVSVDRCLRGEPGNRLAGLMLATMGAGLRPEILDGMLEALPGPFDDPEGDLADLGFGDPFGTDDGNAVA